LHDAAECGAATLILVPRHPEQDESRKTQVGYFLGLAHGGFHGVPKKPRQRRYFDGFLQVFIDEERADEVFHV